MRLDHQSQRVGSRMTRSALIVLVVFGLSACASMNGIQTQATLRDALDAVISGV